MHNCTAGCLAYISLSSILPQQYIC